MIQVLLISSCSVNEVKVGILPIIASYSCNLFQNYFKGAKIWWLFAQLYKNPTDYLFCVESLDVEQISKLESAVLQAKRKKIKFYAQLMKKRELLNLTLDNSKSDKGQGGYQDQIKNVQGKEGSSYQMKILCRKEQRGQLNC